MPVHVSWWELTLRLALSVFAGALLGYNREGGHRSAGLRTTILVCLAAALAMCQAQLLLATHGAPGDSFVQIDVMRLPLGVLSGIGFIGAGAILRRGELVHGVTTAATIWLVTIIGLCFGGGQLALGGASTAGALAVLMLGKRVEDGMRREQVALLTVVMKHEAGDVTQELRTQLHQEGYRTHLRFIRDLPAKARSEWKLELRWLSVKNQLHPPPLLQRLRNDPRVLGVKWHAEGRG